MNDPIIFVKWRKPEQMKNLDGVFVMTRTDYEGGFLTVTLRDNVLVGDTSESFITCYDPECRFYGPVPDCTE